MAGTAPADSFTQQAFEQVALANGCQLVNDAGEITLNSPECQESFAYYTDLIKKTSVKGNQDADTTRATYFAGDAAMVIWSSFLLDELAGLRNDALPTCDQCKTDPTWLAENTGIVTDSAGTERRRTGRVRRDRLLERAPGRLAQGQGSRHLHDERRLPGLAGHLAGGQGPDPDGDGGESAGVRRRLEQARNRSRQEGVAVRRLLRRRR